MTGKVMLPLPALAQDLGTCVETAGVIQMFGLGGGPAGLAGPAWGPCRGQC